MTNKYLYGTDDVPKIPQEVIEARIALLEANLKELLKVHYLGRDGARCNAIIKGIDFWRNL